MTFTMNSNAVRQRLIEESGGSFYIVHKVLSELSAENDTRRLNLETVLEEIRKLRQEQDDSDSIIEDKIPA